MSVAPDDLTLEITRHFDALPTRVFSAWLNRDEFQSWIGLEGIRCEVPLFEPRVGGSYRIAMRTSTGEIVPVTGTFRAIEPPSRLVLTWRWGDDPARHSLITLTFRAKGDGTDMTLHQEGLGSREFRDGNERGWSNTFNKLARHVTGGHP
jgi:uncharacterized protein YndB with AHSA1/START domain